MFFFFLYVIYIYFLPIYLLFLLRSCTQHIATGSIRSRRRRRRRLRLTRARTICLHQQIARMYPARTARVAHGTAAPTLRE